MTQMNMTLNVAENASQVCICIPDVKLLRIMLFFLLYAIINEQHKTKWVLRINLIAYDTRDKALFHSILDNFNILTCSIINVRLSVSIPYKESEKKPCNTNGKKINL